MQQKYYTWSKPNHNPNKWISPNSSKYSDSPAIQIVKNPYNNYSKYSIKVVQVHLVLKNLQKFVKKLEKDLVKLKYNK